MRNNKSRKANWNSRKTPPDKLIILSVEFCMKC